MAEERSTTLKWRENENENVKK